ncbi:dead deah box helicase domain-containing protein [Cyclospora cayetanensis]|uniref:Dead deah box helicase domain-containing protein n=1 Tax=Cyclospora cayetanensis TaxID=88456 RepID=A0A1D3CWT7_9EIME|nr:dead deah box helicase domain-containing protein [Cyclospora cayetanensis]
MPVTSEEAARLLESLKAGGASLEQLQGLLESLKGAAGAGVADGATEEAAHEDEEDDASSSLAASALAPSNAVPVSDMGRNTIAASLLLSGTDLKLSKELLLAVEALGFKAPSKIQAAALPLVLNHRENLIAQALCLCPTRELAQQTVFVLKSLARFTRLQIFLAVPQSRPGVSEFPDGATADESSLFSPNAEGREVVFSSNTSPDVRQQIVVGTPGLPRASASAAFLAASMALDPSDARRIVLRLSKKPDCAMLRGIGALPADFREAAVACVFSVIVCASTSRKVDGTVEEAALPREHGADVQQIRRFLPNDLQILLFSATYSDTVRQFAEKLIPRANKITLKREELTLSCIQQFYMVADPRLPPPEAPGGPPGGDPLELEAPSYLMLPQHLQRPGAPVDRELVMRVFKHKYEHLKTLYGALAVGQSVIFVNSRRLAFFLALKLQKELSFSVSLICGSQAQGPEKLSIEIRDRIMKEFRRGETKVLICTDVLSRGIDVPQVTLVVNFDLPIYYTGRGRGPQPDVAGGPGVPFGGPPGFEESWEGQHVDRRGQRIVPSGIDFPDGVCVNFETYLHRIGRTGRFGLRGIAVNLVCPEEMFLLDQIRSFYKCRIDELSSDTEAIEAIIRNLRTEG